ncbi:unnamed protein product, partial [Porites lobata]
PPGHYSSIGDILSKMKELIENVKRFNDDVTFSYDAFTRKVTIHLQNNVELFFGNIGYLLGFSPDEIISNTSTAERQVDLEYGFHDLFIYCDLIQSQYVGDALYYVNQAKQKGGSLPAFHGARFQHGYGLGSIFRGLFRWAMPHLQQGAKVIGKKALQTGVNVVQDVLDGDNIKTAVHKRTKQALGLPSQNSLQTQSGAGKKAIKRKGQGTKI